jgi:hypothetical protein
VNAAPPGQTILNCHPAGVEEEVAVSGLLCLVDTGEVSSEGIGELFLHAGADGVL